MSDMLKVASFSELQDRKPAYALAGEVDLVVVRYDDNVSVLYGRCLHRAPLMSDGHVEGNNLFCGVHNWDYRIDTGVSCLLYTSPSPRDKRQSRMPSSA